jgi:tetratricopeptide (TPR) repeat protein
MVNKFRASVLTVLVLLASTPLSGQVSAPPTGKPLAPGLIKLTGDDEKRAKELDEQIDKATKADRWDEAIARAEQILGLRKWGLGPKHFETVNAEWHLKALQRIAEMPKEDRVAYQSVASLHGQAKTLDDEGKYTAAQGLHEKALEIHCRLLTDDHPDTATLYDSLASNLNAQAKYASAQPLSEKALKIRRRLLTDGHPSTATSYNNLAHDLEAQGKYTQAQPLYEKALEIHRRLLTDDHPRTALNYNNVAHNLKAQGKYAAAQPLYEKALGIRRRLLTDVHRETAASYNNLAGNLNAQGKYGAAQPLYEKALEIFRRLLGDEHPDTAASSNNLAYNLQNQGKYAAAQLIFEKTLAIRRRVLTEDHPHTAASYGSLATNLNLQGKYAMAQPLYEKALEIHRRLLTDDHPHTVRSYNNLAVNLNSQRKYAAAQRFYERALEIDQRLLTDDHPDTANNYNNLAYNLNVQRKYMAAQPLFEKALTIRRRLLTDDHPLTAQTYSNLATNLADQGQFEAAQRLDEKVLEIRRRLLSDYHPNTATSYNNLADDLLHQGKYAAAQPLYEKALEIRRRMLTDNHPETAISLSSLAANLSARGRHREAREYWLLAMKSREATRLQVAFTGLERAEAEWTLRPSLVAVLARLGQPAEAWQHLEEDLGRGLLDELAARQDQRLAPGDRARLRDLIAALERLDKLVESTPKDLDQAERTKRFEELKRQRELSSIALGEFQTKLVQDHGPLAGQVANLKDIQAALPADAALIAWVDIPPAGPKAADPNGEHWGVVIRSRGNPAWVLIAGTGPKGLWSQEDTELVNRVRTELRNRPGSGSAKLPTLLDRLRTQRLQPMAKALGATADGLPLPRRLIVLPSPAMAGIPIEVLQTPDDMRIVSYAPSATVFKYLREQPRPNRHTGLLALGDPIFLHPDKSNQPRPLPEHGLLVNVVVPGSNAATHGLKPGDVLLAYNGTALNKKDDLKISTDGGKAITAEVWRDGRASHRDLAPGKLGVVLDPKPAPEAIAEQHKLQKVLVAAHRGDEDFPSLSGTRYEVEALTRLFQADDRPIRSLFGADASEPELDHIATSGELERFDFIHLATHGVIDEDVPTRSAVILTQTGLPDPLAQALSNKPVFDGRLSVREIQRTWELKAELVTLSACETALGRAASGEGFVGFTQALLMSGARSVCLSLWKVDDTATALLMHQFYANLLGRRSGLTAPLPKAEALQEAKVWLRGLRRSEVLAATAALSGGIERGKGAKARQSDELSTAIPTGKDDDRPYAAPYYWAAFVLAGDPD